MQPNKYDNSEGLVVSLVTSLLSAVLSKEKPRARELAKASEQPVAVKSVRLGKGIRELGNQIGVIGAAVNISG